MMDRRRMTALLIAAPLAMTARSAGATGDDDNPKGKPHGDQGQEQDHHQGQTQETTVGQTQTERGADPMTDHPDSATATCRSCGAPIRWVTMPSGKAAPIDAEPVADGTIVVFSCGDAAYVRTGEAVSGVRHASHFATCPNAAAHRRTAR